VPSPTDGPERATDGHRRGKRLPDNPCVNLNSTHTTSRPRHGIRGFTLIELLIVVAIVGILGAVAYPSYTSSIRKSRRADAVATLSKVQQAQERWRSNHSTYAGNAQLTTAHPNGLAIPSTTENGYYTVAISGESATGYVVTATAVSGKSQAQDTACTPLVLTVVNGNVTGNTPTTCWSK
jgi:type IV pilus assembly protein PilE